jgi:hypothetical protein
MCKLCDEGQPRNHFGSRRNFLKGCAAGASIIGSFQKARRRIRIASKLCEVIGR